MVCIALAVKNICITDASYGTRKLTDIISTTSSTEDGADSPNEMTPIAWKTPLLIRIDPLIGPRMSSGTLGPCVITVTRITSMLISARALAFASWSSDQHTVYHLTGSIS